MTNRMTMLQAAESSLGAYLRDRRMKLDPAALGFPSVRRRTLGLRREEVAQRANISPTWYTWLEQGRGGAPSAEVLDRIAHALMLTDVEREHLFSSAWDDRRRRDTTRARVSRRDCSVCSMPWTPPPP